MSNNINDGNTPRSDVNLDQVMDIAIAAVKAGGSVISNHYRDRAFTTRCKDDGSMQTTVDVESETRIISFIRNAFPDHNINSEEQGESIYGSSDRKWLVDPLDGTDNFILGLPYFSVSVAFCENTHPLVAAIYNPITEELYTARKGIGAFLGGNRIHVAAKTNLGDARAFFIPDGKTKLKNYTLNLRKALYKNCRRLLDTWSPALDWCLVANGNADALICVSSRPVSPNAGTLLLEEAGGVITDFQGVKFGVNNSGCLIAGSQNVRAKIQAIIQGHYLDDELIAD